MGKCESWITTFATKADLKHAKSVDTPKFPEEVDLAGLNLEIDKLF